MPANPTATRTTITGELPPLPRTPLLRLLRDQARITGALMMREIYTRFGRDNIGFAWIIAEPAIFCLAVILLWSLIKHQGHAETPIVPFLLTGYMPLLLFRHMTGRLLRCMQANAALLYHRAITILTLYMARIGVEVLGTSAAFASCLVIFWFAGFVEVPDDPSLMLGGWLLYAWFAAATAIGVGALSERSEVAEKIWNPISYIMIPLSGTFYMVHWIPAEYRESLLWMPPINGVEMIRGGYFGPAVPTYFDPIYLVFVNLLLTAAGLLFVKDARSYVEIE
jgi:capsular polysaccharide transport system permease protein